MNQGFNNSDVSEEREFKTATNTTLLILNNRDYPYEFHLLRLNRQTGNLTLNIFQLKMKVNNIFILPSYYCISKYEI